MNQSISLVEKFEEDIERGIFKNYSSFIHPAYSIEVNTIEDAIALLLYHDGLHFGYSMAIKRMIEVI